jgi:D-alanyl-D-alanine carboxypeptidase
MTEHLLFRVGSNTKTFVITVLLQLVDEKKIPLDDKLDKFYPEFPRSSEVTIRQLCDMSSGIFNFWESQNFIDWIVANPHKVGTPWEFISWAIPNPYPYGFDIGKGFYYSNTNTYLIGLIIEKITGNPIELEVKTRIIDRLQLRDTFFPVTYTFPAGTAYSKGYRATSDLKGPKDFSEFLDPCLRWAAGAIISNTDDMRIWVKECAVGSFLSKETQAERLKTRDFPQMNSKYGLGITEYRGFLGHGGDTFGYHTIFLYSPTRKTTVAVLLNMDEINQHLAAQKIIDLYLAL